MPFLTEELWQRLTRKARAQFAPSLCVAKYPRTVGERSVKLEEEIERVMQIVHGARTVRQVYNLKGKDRPPLVINTHTARDKELLASHVFVLAMQSLARVGDISITFNESQPPLGAASAIPNSSTEIYVVIKDLVDVDTEIAKLNAQIKNLEEQIAGLEKKRADPNWETKTPAKVKETLQTKLDAINSELTIARTAVENFKKLKN